MLSCTAALSALFAAPAEPPALRAFPHPSPCAQVGYNYFRLHPKGVGLVCKRKGGLPPLTFVEEYLGEIHTPWRWFEIQVGGWVGCGRSRRFSFWL